MKIPEEILKKLRERLTLNVILLNAVVDNVQNLFPKLRP